VYTPTGILLVSNVYQTDAESFVIVNADPKNPFVDGTTYSVTISAYSSNQSVSTSTTVPYKYTLPPTPPTPPTNISVVAVGPGQVKVSWTTPTTFGTGGFGFYRIFAYCITDKPGGCFSITSDVNIATQTSGIVDNLTSGNSYLYMVTVENKVSLTARSLTTPVLQFVDPLMITKLTPIVPNTKYGICKSASIEWNALSTNDPAPNYIITASASGYPTATCYSATTSGTLIPVTAGVTYSVVISAKTTAPVVNVTSRPYSFTVPQPKVPLPTVSSITLSKSTNLAGSMTAEYAPIPRNIDIPEAPFIGYDVWFRNITTGVDGFFADIAKDMTFPNVSITGTVGNVY
jgi:hypothetical protein